MSILEVDDLSNVDIHVLLECLQPDVIIERLLAYKANNLNNPKDFVNLKGIKGQLEHSDN